ncbi:hypothetical protein ACHWQZ_G019597 [Mnemiopsis leidyi]
MRSYPVAVLLIAVVVAILLFQKDDLIEARGSRGGGSRSSGTRSSSSSSSRYSRYSGSTSYSDRRRTTIYDSRRRTDYSRRRSTSDYDYSRRRTTYDSRRRSTYFGGNTYDLEKDYRSSGGGLGAGAIIGIVLGIGGFILVACLCCKHCDESNSHRGTMYTTPAYEDVGPENETPAVMPGGNTVGPAGYSADPSGPVGYAAKQSPAYFSNVPTSAPPPLPSAEYSPQQYSPASCPPTQYPPAPFPTCPSSGLPDYQPGMQAPPLPLPSLSEEEGGGLPEAREGGYPPSAPPALPTYSYPAPPDLPTFSSSSIVPPPPTIAPPDETVDDPSMHVSAPKDAPPPSYNDLYKS